MDQSNRTDQIGLGATKLKIALIGSSVPKKCGIATFSRDLINGLNQETNLEYSIIAAESDKESYIYDSSVIAKIKISSRASYLRAAEQLKILNPDVILLQHEFGLFGGDWTKVTRQDQILDYPLGTHIISLLEQLRTPIITTLHTVLSDPDIARLKVIAKIAKMSQSIVTMSQDAKNLLIEKYFLPAGKIEVIPHGVHRPKMSKASARRRLGIPASDKVLAITGLISYNKGVDIAIEALKLVKQKFPNIKLLIVGQTHPNIIKDSGEVYRDSLHKLVKQNKLESNVIFVNEYLPTDQLLTYMQAADIYLTLHRDLDQAASGTLAYALGAGLVCVSTPYRYAKELLGEACGLLVSVDDVKATAKAIKLVLSDNKLYHSIQNCAIETGKSMDWQIVSRQYLGLMKPVPIGIK